MNTVQLPHLDRPAAFRPPARAGQPTRMMTGPVLSRLCLLLALALAAVVGLVPVLTTPTVVPADAPPTEFSAERAMQHVRAIAAEPHPMGSAAHESAVAYIVGELTALGLQPEVQTTSIAVPAEATEPGVNAVVGGRVENIVVRLPGRASTGTVLLIGNYDSMPTTPGAADPVSGGAALLETLRAVRAGEPLQNDVIAAFIDVEPAGLIGDRAFATEHRWGRDADVALAFPALGRRGPVTLFFTTGENGRLMAEVMRTPNPLVYSVLTELMRPVGGVFLHEEIAHGAAGLEFTSFREIQFYHTMLNRPDRLDPGLLQHVGSYQLGLARAFGDLPLDRLNAPDEIVFTMAPGLVVRYPAAWAPALAALAGLLLAGVAVVGLRRQRLSIGGLAIGILAFPAMVIGVLAVVTAIWDAIKALHPHLQVVLLGTAYNADVYYLGLLALAVALAAALYGWLGRRARPENLTMGGIVWWGGLVGLTSLAMPGVSYFFTWPLLAALLALGWDFLAPVAAARPWPRAAVLALGAVPVVLLVAPLFPILTALKSYFEYPWAATAPFVGGLAFLPIALALGLLVPHFHFLSVGRRWLLPTVAASLGIVIIGFAAVSSRFDAERPRPNSIAYLLDADRGEAAWVSGDAQLDDWTRQFFPNGAVREGFVMLPDALPETTLPGWRGPAPTLPLPAPEATVLDDATRDGLRELRLRLTSPRGATELIVDVEAPSDLTAWLDGKPIDWGAVPPGNRSRLHLAYHGLPAEGIELALTSAAGPVQLLIEDRSNGLPAVPGLTVAPRPPDMMPAMYLQRDPTIVIRSLVLEP